MPSVAQSTLHCMQNSRVEVLNAVETLHMYPCEALLLYLLHACITSRQLSLSKGHSSGIPESPNVEEETAARQSGLHYLAHGNAIEALDGY